MTELQENTEALKTKMSELRLYCDLLLQQVNKIKENDEQGDAAEVRIMLSQWNKRSGCCWGTLAASPFSLFCHTVVHSKLKFHPFTAHLDLWELPAWPVFDSTLPVSSFTEVNNSTQWKSAVAQKSSGRKKETGGKTNWASIWPARFHLRVFLGKICSLKASGIIMGSSWGERVRRYRNWPDLQEPQGRGCWLTLCSGCFG